MDLPTINQVNSLLVLQRRSKGGIGDALVTLGHVSQEDMDRFFDEFEQTKRLRLLLTLTIVRTERLS